jgi:hypothetical protein
MKRPGQHTSVSIHDVKVSAYIPGVKCVQEIGAFLTSSKMSCLNLYPRMPSELRTRVRLRAHSGRAYVRFCREGEIAWSEPPQAGVERSIQKALLDLPLLVPKYQCGNTGVDLVRLEDRSEVLA